MQSFKSIQRRNARRRKEMLCSAIVMTIGLGIYLQRAKKSAAAGQRQVRSPNFQSGSEKRGQIVIWCTRWREKSKPGSRLARQVKQHRSLMPCPGLYRKPVRVGESREQAEVERQRRPGRDLDLPNVPRDRADAKPCDSGGRPSTRGTVWGSAPRPHTTCSPPP